MCAPFIDSVFIEKLVSNFPSINFTIVYHSNLGFLSQDRFSVYSLLPFFEIESRYPNFRVGTNSEEFSNAIEQASNRKFLYLPNLIHLPYGVRRQRPKNKSNIIHIGLFGASRVLKNWLTATVAVMIIANKTKKQIVFHVSGKRDEGAVHTRANMMDLLKLNPNVSLVDVPWLDHDDFLRYLYSMDLLLQPSFTETFNNVTAEGCLCGVPSVVSEAIFWVPDSWKSNADSAVDIANVGIKLLNDKSVNLDGWKALNNYNKKSEKQWLTWINS
jgi:hypothetical protein